MIRSVSSGVAQQSGTRYMRELVHCTVVLLACVVSSVSVAAQTLFGWPDSRVDVTKYSYLENCRAAAGRVADSVKVERNVLRDTVEQTRESSIRPLDASVIEIANRCLERYDISQIPLTDAFLAQELYLIAGRDRDADLIARRRLAAVPMTDTVTRAQIMDSIARLYLNAKPSRLDMGQNYADSIMALGKAVPVAVRLGVDLAVFFAGRSSFDWPVTQRGGSRFLQNVRDRSDEERRDPIAPIINAYAAGVSRAVFQSELLDSLKVSTDAFIRLQNSLYSAVVKERDFDRAIGEPVAKLQGDVWFPDSAKKESYPRRGRTTLIYFERSAHVSTPDYQLVHAVLRRVGNAFPEVDIVVAAHTLGHFGNVEPPAPEQEAFLLDTLIGQFYKIPGVLTVTQRPYLSLEAPDNRKVRHAPENAINYPGRAINCFYLVDPDGRLLWYNRINSVETETDLKRMLGALRERRVQQQ